MKTLTEIEISANYDKLLAVINDNIAPPRLELLIKLYSDKQEIIAFAPASGKEHYHNCYIGGYVEHVLNVIDIALKVDALWTDSGAINSHTTEELIFAALNHDLGKIGEGDQPYYIPNPSDWHRKNQGAIYTQNPAVNFMPVQDRSLFTLQEYGITCSFNEYVAIKTHDGLYDKGNEAYLISWSDDGKLRTNLPYILHQADMMASRIEYQQFKNSQGPYIAPPKKAVTGTTATSKAMNTLAAKPSSAATSLFDELFNTK